MPATARDPHPDRSVKSLPGELHTVWEKSSRRYYPLRPTPPAGPRSHGGRAAEAAPRHLRHKSVPLLQVILVSWGIAFFE